MVFLKKATVVGLAGLVVGASPAAADSLSEGSTVVLTMVGGGGLSALGCMAISLLTEDQEEDEQAYERRGFYAGLASMYARQNFSDSSVVNVADGELQENLRSFRGTPTPMDPGLYTFGFDRLDKDAFGFTGRVGYRCHPYISTELQFDWLKTFDGAISETDMPMNDTPRNFDTELESLAMTTNFKGHLLTGRYQPFLLMGFGFMRMESKTRDASGGAIMGFAPQARERYVRAAARFGGGLDVYITEKILVNAEGSYLMPTGKLDGMDYYAFNIGLQYRF